MRRLAWRTDLHLNFVTPGHVDRRCRTVRDAGAGAVLLGGDIGEAPDLVERLAAHDPGEGASGHVRPRNAFPVARGPAPDPVPARTPSRTRSPASKQTF